MDLVNLKNKINFMEIAKNSFKQKITNWVNLYSDDLFSMAFNKVNNESVAQDLVQDTFIDAFKSIEKFKAESSPKTWLISILKNKIAMYYRQLFKNKTISLSKFDYMMFDDNGKWIDKNNLFWNNETELLDNNNFKLVLAKCIKGLPELWELVIQLKFIDGQQGTDICNDLELSESNYWQIIHRSKLKLRHCLNLNWFNNN